MKRASLALVVSLVALLSAAVVPAHAELSQKGNLFIRFDGGISPNTLPRSVPAPISVRVEGTIRQIGGAEPPAT
jgi:hypothetical protein